jgi:hypothetical protein
MEEKSGPAGWIAAALPIDAVLTAHVEHPTVVWLDRRKQTRHECHSLSTAAKPIASHTNGISGSPMHLVMPGLVPGIHVLLCLNKDKTWMAGTSPAMTAG